MNNLIKFPYKKPPPPAQRTTMLGAFQGLATVVLSFIVVYAATLYLFSI